MPCIAASRRITSLQQELPTNQASSRSQEKTRSASRVIASNPTMADDRAHHDAEAVSQHLGVEGQCMSCPGFSQCCIAHRIRKSFRASPSSCRPGHGPPPRAVIEQDRLDQRQPSHHRGQQHGMRLAAGGVVVATRAWCGTKTPGRMGSLPIQCAEPPGVSLGACRCIGQAVVGMLSMTNEVDTLAL